MSLLPTDKEEQDSSRQLTQMSATQECHVANLDLQASKAVTAVAPFYGCLCWASKRTYDLSTATWKTPGSNSSLITDREITADS